MRESIRLASGVLVALIASVSAASAVPCNQITIPPNPHFEVAPGILFEDSPEYQQEMDAAVKAAREVCEAHLHDKNPALVFDIDDTLLCNKDEVAIQLQKAGTGTKELTSWNEEAWVAWATSANAPAITQTAQLVRWAKSKGFSVFLITAREVTDRESTKLNLLRQNIPYDALILKPSGSTETAEDYKTGYRKILEQQGFTIVCNLGDQYSDLYGLHSIDCEKLPNRMYFTK